MKRVLPRRRRFDRAKNIDELAEIARRRLPNFVYEYIHGGADDEVSLANNRAVFDRYRFTPRTLTDVSQRSLTARVLGREIAMPMIIGPTGFNGMITQDGDMKLARAAARQDIPFTLSNASTTSLEEIATVESGWNWMQIYFYRDRDYVEALIERCRAAGYDTLVVTTDSAIYGNREWDARNYARPLVLDTYNKLHTLTRPSWIKDVLYPDGIPTFKNLGDLLPPGDDSVQGAASAIGEHLMPSLSWKEMRWLRERWPGKLLIKGILCVEEARQAVAEGMDGIVLSNHGGRQLDGAVSALEILREVRAAVGDEMTLLLDGGFRRGSDVLKARLLGADAVMLGRATLYGLGAGGEPGVDHALRLLQAELDRNLGLLGCRHLQELNDAFLREGH
ncbi:alpha-hydroxy acid oxidase [Salinicola halophilus]|uniref:alpha-hydroxy acid oxidase n=1 Tax=Salinicola halophilus TaxID=184065 RepID=UPI000DA15DFD|nr:alpha-hydroxy acid oxidase [Salinicola halophilus]